MEHAGRDLQHAWRMILRMPGLAAVVIISLGVGIGVNTAIFSWIQTMVLQPLPGVPASGSFHLLEPRSDSGSYPGMSWLEYRDLHARLLSFRDLLAFRMVPLNVGETNRAERTYGLLVSDNYFSALELRPALGRFFRPDEVARAGGEPVVVISHEYWQHRFGGAPSAAGATLRVNDRLLTIVGVTPPGFQGTVLGLNFDLWVPATLTPVLLSGSRELEDRTLRGYSAMGRLRPQTTRAQAQNEADAAMRQLAESYPETNATTKAEVLHFWQAERGPQRLLLRGLTILQGVMLLLLLAVCGNTANLVLARASTRQREIGVRLAIGAGPWRVASLLFSENLMLALLGAALGAVIAAWGTDALRAVPLSTAFPIRFQTHVDGIGLAFATLLGIACGVLFGAGPAVHLARVDPQTALRSGSNSAGRSRTRNFLMGAEVALALLVLIAAGLFFRSFSETHETDPGFRRDGVLLSAYDFTGRNVDGAFTRAFAARLLERLRALPSVESAAIATYIPLDIHGMPLRSFRVDGHTRSDAGLDQALTNIVTPGYFKTMGIPLRAGADFVDLNDVTTVPQAIVNEEFVRRYVERAEPLGRGIQAGTRRYVIAGVVRNSFYDSFGESPIPIIYFSYRDRPPQQGQIHLRTRAGGETLLAPEVRRVIRELDPALPIYDVRTLNEHLETNQFLRRIPARMFVVLGPLLLLLAAIGIYAVVAYAVSRRTTEIGVRLAMGATAGRVVRQFVRETLGVIAIGMLAGWLIAVVVAIHAMKGRIDLPVFVGVPLILLVVSTAACWIPASRATKIDPLVALRQD